MSATSTLPTTVDEIPLIDFQPFLAGSRNDRLAVAQQVRDACETIGFLYLRNHGVPDAASRQRWQRRATSSRCPTASGLTPPS